MMRRREFITLLGGAAAAWPLAARAQQSPMPVIGFLGSDASGWSTWTAAFAAGLSELGWIDGRTVAIVYRWSEGRPERVAEIASEFVRLKPDVIVAMGSAVPALRQATALIPIVFIIATDPLGDGLVVSLARPGGNVTGLSQQSSELAGRRLELMREAFPGLRRVAILVDVGYPGSIREMGEVQAAARTLGLDVVPLEIRRTEDIAPAFETLTGIGEALYIVGDALINANRTRIITLALGARLPTMFYSREFVQAGALMSYGTNYSAHFRRAAALVDKILRGAKPGDIPVEQPTKFDLAINLTTAKAIKLTIPESFLLRADELIE